MLLRAYTSRASHLIRFTTSLRTTATAAPSQSRRTVLHHHRKIHTNTGGNMTPPSTAAPRKRRNIFLDFDGTITTQDTISELARFALSLQASRGRGTELEAAWDKVVKAYMTGYKACVDGHHTPAARRTTRDQEVEFLRQMKDSEVTSLERIRECEVFRGITPDEFRAAGRRLVEDGTIKLRPGFHEFVSRMQQQQQDEVGGEGVARDGGSGSGCKVWVLSVNWSSAFIEGACWPSRVHVIANNISSADGSVVGPELLLSPRSADHRTLTNSVDKLDAMRAALASVSAEFPGFAAETVYMGDSITDMECILAADRAIVMSDAADSTLLETLRRVGTEVRNVADGEPGGIVWASSFEEIEKQGFC
ncbi:hypothetical protein Micbo1qcDRAFT_162529 [Microdochium bolleyi]|uniref:HAD-like domain-containing protein n=1 Tax=Microdochium bolleyi TaxID=196109 RepID=A0A136J5A4_9PEZI|nr:hypothetical protein Micbo1qcDRAFT_162529 [Microdochium bolleyi]